MSVKAEKAADATAIRPYEDNRILINLSVWTDLAALFCPEKL